MMRDISLHIMDIMQNSIKAGANYIELKIWVDINDDLLYVDIIDNGCGMDEEFIKRVISPFTTTRTTRSIGLGIPLYKQSAEIAGGSFGINSKLGEGTRISVSYSISNIDRLPLGDIGDTIIGNVLSYPDLRYKLFADCSGREFVFDSEEIKAQLGEVPITEYSVISWIHEYIDEGIREVFQGILKEIV